MIRIYELFFNETYILHNPGFNFIHKNMVFHYLSSINTITSTNTNISTTR